MLNRNFGQFCHLMFLLKYHILTYTVQYRKILDITGAYIERSKMT